MAVKPLNRLQAFLAKIAGESAPDLTPRNVTEYYLDKIADSGSGGVNVINLDEIPVYTVQEGVTNLTTRIWLDDGGWYDSYEKWFVSDFEVPAILTYNSLRSIIQTSSFAVQTINNYVAENPVGTNAGCYLMSADTVYIVSTDNEGLPVILFAVNPTVQYRGSV